jgi:hypothetical protein
VLAWLSQWACCAASCAVICCWFGFAGYALLVCCWLGCSLLALLAWAVLLVWLVVLFFYLLHHRFILFTDSRRRLTELKARIFEEGSVFVSDFRLLTGVLMAIIPVASTIPALKKSWYGRDKHL